jgi:tRNA A-37 threonylcarbamoyl transferase component Bud32/tetratricopeptide (TPR) repeat protein
MERPSLTHVGPYRLLHLLGSGGMGDVFAAVDEQIGRRVALKLLSRTATGDPQLVARFLQEARALAQLEHPGVVRVFHCDRLGDLAFLAMEHLQGLSLREWMQRQPGPVPLQAAVTLCKQIAAVMVDVHAQGIVHRDLKPENVFLCPDETTTLGYRIKLLDFGIAKLPPAADGVLAATQVHTHESSFIGTYAYMAPEQLRSASTVDGRADVYALGVLLFELLAGRVPFVSDDPVDIISAHLRDAPPPLKQLVPTLPGALSAFIASMLAKEPAERPAMARCRDMLGTPWEKAHDACPVPGLAPFTEAQAELFFGRKAETQALLALLEEARVGRKRWVQLEGPSGVGKSSLIQAGLLPRLRELPAQGALRWIVATLRPSYEPLRNLARALAAAYASTGPQGTAEEIERVLSRGPDALRAFIASHTPEGCLLLLVIDPMEELFTLGTAECHRLDALLSTALAAPECPLRLFTSLRSDFLHRMEQLPSVARQLHGAARYPLLPMEEEALARVIQGMAWHAGLQLDHGLAARMVRDARGEGSRLPLLGHALRELWALSGGVLLTLEHYERLGGVGGALARQAEGLLDSLGGEGKERAKWLLLELVQAGRGVPDTRRPRSRDEVLMAAGGDPLAEKVLLRLTGMRTSSSPEEDQGLRLVMLSGGEQPSHQRAELVHETLLHKVPSLAAWIEQERALLERHEDLEAAAHAWEQAQCPAEGLPTGTLLTHYRGGPGALRGNSPLMRRVSASAARFLQAAERLERRRAWSRRALVAASVIGGLIILFYAVRAEQERQRAEENLRRFITVTESFVRDSDWKLSRFPGTLEERSKMLQGYQETLESLPENERQQPKVLLTLIRVLQRRADLAFHNGPLAEADSLLVEALEELRTGLTYRPEDWELREELALNHSKRGKVELAKSRWDEALGHFIKAQTLLEELGVKSGEDEEDYWRTLAVSLSERAEAELELGRLRDAAERYERAIALHRQSRGAYTQYLLALTLGDRSEVARRSGEPEAEERFLREALAAARACVEAQQGNQLFQWVMARTLVRLGALQADQGRPEAARRDYQEAQELGQALHRGEPTNKRYALVLAQALLGHEKWAQAQGETKRAQSLHTGGCALIRKFRSGDGEDVRFHFLSCQGEQKEK